MSNEISTEPNKDFIERLYEMKNLAARFEVKLIVLFNPVACGGMSKDLNEIVTKVNVFKKMNQDVYVPFDFITHADKENFSDEWHLTPEGAEVHSHNIGLALARL